MYWILGLCIAIMFASFGLYCARRVSATEFRRTLLEAFESTNKDMLLAPAKLYTLSLEDHLSIKEETFVGTLYLRGVTGDGLAIVSCRWADVTKGNVLPAIIGGADRKLLVFYKGSIDFRPFWAFVEV